MDAILLAQIKKALPRQHTNMMIMERLQIFWQPMQFITRFVIMELLMGRVGKLYQPQWQAVCYARH